jgi:hypothetical protein
LLPEPHNSTIIRLLFTCAHWHGLAKLRTHTDSTLRILDETTISIGAEFRAFAAKTCASFDTRELSREMEARKRRSLKKEREKSGLNTSGDQATSNAQSDVSGNETTFNGQVATNNQSALNGTAAPGSKSHPGPRRKNFNLKIYKYHCLGDYANTIRRCGTTDSFSTELVGNCHEVP